MQTRSDCGPAFPYLPGRIEQIGNGLEVHHAGDVPGMSLREYAAIALCVPDSGNPPVDLMIRTALRDRMAEKAMQGMLANHGLMNGGKFHESNFIAAYQIADKMLEARARETA